MAPVSVTTAPLCTDWRHCSRSCTSRPGVRSSVRARGVGQDRHHGDALNSGPIVGKCARRPARTRRSSVERYATTIGGRDVVFSIIGNGDDTKLTTKVMDELVETIVSYGA